MGNRELLLLLGAITIFGVLVSNTNRYMVEVKDVSMQREFTTYANSLAQSVIDEAKTKAYDGKVVGGSPPLPAGFTGHGALGPEPGEVYPNFDDVDDYNGFTGADSLMLGDYSINVWVNYVNETTPDDSVHQKTFCKKMTVQVTSDYLNHPLETSYVFGYMKN